MSQALYRTYRSKSLADVVGQDHITDILSRALKSGRIAHAYLLTGPRGVGKTSVARILAHEINNLPYTEDSTHLDIIEIDAASNNGVEDVRDLREKVQIAPVSAAKKVYIIDEVHMLSKPAFNALLKTLEEPPAHVVFILATTDVEKLPATIVSRTQRFGFRAITPTDAVDHLREIAAKEKITITDEALERIAERGDGSFRDSISLLDQLSSLADEKEGITAQLVETSLGLAPATVVTDLLQAVEKHDVTSIAQQLDDTFANGISATTLTDQLIQTVRREVIKTPQLLPLLDSLLDVPKSSHPSIKLLSVLGSYAYEPPKAKSAALSAPILEVTATIQELSRQATKAKPELKEKPVATLAPASIVEPKEASVESSDTSASESQPLQPVIIEAPRPSNNSGAKPLTNSTGESDTSDKKPVGAKVAGDAEFDWNALIEHARQNYVALFSVLSKCGHELTEDTLTLFTGNAFYKKKLDDPKYSGHLYESIKSLYGYQLSINTIPTQAPLSSSQAASVAAIMGGGKEVSVETS